MHGNSAAASSAKSPVAATRSRKSVYARVVGAMGSRSSSASAIPSSRAYARWRSISVRAVAWRRSACC